MKVLLNDFIGVRGRSGSSRGAALVAEAVAGGNVQIQTLRPKGEPVGRVMRLLHMLLWDFVLVPIKSARLKAAVVIHATNTGVAIGRTKSVLILHDTMVLDHPQLFNKYFVLYAKLCMALSVAGASQVVTPSLHSKRRIQARWPKANVSVIPWPPYREEDSSPGQLLNAPESLQVLVVSSADKHKRLPMAVEAVAAARKESGQDLQLVMVTRPGNDNENLEKSLSLHDPKSGWTTKISGIDDEMLRKLYRESFCVLVSSIDEGFCLPALEATINGVPVVHTNRGALPEVVPRDFLAGSDPANDLDSLCRQLLDLMDVEHWKRVRDADRKHSLQFNKRSFEKNWAKILDQVVNS